MTKLTTSNQVLASLLAVSALAEHQYNAAERGAVRDIASELEAPELPALVEQEISRIRDLRGQDLAICLAEAGKAVTNGEEAYVMEAVMQVMLADGVLAYTESSNLIIIANALHFNHSLLLLMMADAMHDGREIQVKFEE